MSFIDSLRKERDKKRKKTDYAQAAKNLRGNKTDEEWVIFLGEIAEKQTEILNKMIETVGPKNISFYITMVDENERK